MLRSHILVGASWSLTATSLALLVYAMVQFSTQQLTLHNSILVSYFTVLNCMASYSVWLLIPAPFSGVDRRRAKAHAQSVVELQRSPWLHLAMDIYYKPISFPLYLQYVAVFTYSGYIWFTA